MLRLLLLAHGAAAEESAAAAVAAAVADHDVEILRPRLGMGAFAGVDDATTTPKGGLRPFWIAQYEHEPVVFYSEGNWFGTVVGRRFWSELGVAYGALRWLDVGAGIPVAYSFGSDDTRYTADGAALGDLQTIARARVLHVQTFDLLVRAEASWPLGTRSAWMSDPLVRPSVAVVAALTGERVRGSVDLGVLGRPVEDSGAHWILSTQFTGGAAFAWAAVPRRLDLNYALATRIDTEAPGLRSSRAIELLFGVTGHPGRGVDVATGGGVGLSGGVGEPTARAFVDLRWLLERAKPKVEPAIVADVSLPEAEVPEPPPPEAPPTTRMEVWKEDQLARVEENEITIRDPIQFEFAKDVILPESLPTLVAVAELLRTDGRILHVVIQGHASDEGSFIYNYDLSGRRARAVWEALVRAGVHPDRISYQGMGEVVPTRVGHEETELAANRRVLFRIVRLLEPGETAPSLPGAILIPWSGEAGQTVTPPPPPAPPPPPTIEDDEDE
ncbi:hypothetical protein LBMAG42_10830 [Deltaproteobacteria bacterium]|nr:hypothetical protein LBMAG42_10830 [Deltaproteobacteria bacterium]